MLPADTAKRPWLVPAIGGGILTLAVVAGVVWWQAWLPGNTAGKASTAAAAGIRSSASIVVLPFQNMSDDPPQEYFADGISEDLTTDLSHIPELFVISRNSAFTYKGASVNALRVGEERGVRYLLEGSARKAGNRSQ